MRSAHVTLAAFASAAIAVPALAQATAAQRQVQVRFVDLSAQVVEVHNFGTTTVGLTGWRFCTHDENQILQYSAFGGLNGQSIAPGASLFVHWNNDAAAANEINISTIGGGFSTPLDGGASGDAFAIGLYVNSGFGSGLNLADHVQWSFNGVDNTTADERSDEAESGGVWTDQSQWIPTTASSTGIQLNDSSGGVLHGPADYTVLPPPPPNCVGDLDGDNDTDVLDFAVFAGNFGQSVPPNTQGDFDGNGVVNVLDFAIFSGDFGCTP